LDVYHYNLSFEIDHKSKTIKGIASIKLNQIEKDDNLSLNFYDNFDIQSVLLNNEQVEYESDGNKLIILLNSEIPDSSELIINYFGTPQSKGLGSFNFGTYQQKPYVYSLSEPVFASSWFPCNDLPDDKATLEMKITTDSSLVSISNGRLINVKTFDSLKTFHYRTDYPISTYLIALYSGDYVTFNDFYISADKQESMEIRYYVTPDKLDAAKIDFSIHPKIFEVFTELFGDYAFKDDGYGVAQFWWNSGAMEHQTITGISHNFISGNKFYTNFLVHEVAHHWWGNAVGPMSWQDIWLNEGFSTYSEALYWEVTTGVESLRSTMNGFRRPFDQSTLYDPGIYMFSRLTYEKGAWVLHMLRRELGDKLFFECLRNYFEKYKYKNAETNDFIELCENVSSRELDWFFEQWVYLGQGILEIEYDWQNKSHGTELNLKQVQTGFENYRYLLEVTAISKDSSVTMYEFNISTVDTTVWISDENIVSLTLDPDYWLLAEFTELNKEKE